MEAPIFQPSLSGHGQVDKPQKKLVWVERRAELKTATSDEISATFQHTRKQTDPLDKTTSNEWRSDLVDFADGSRCFTAAKVLFYSLTCPIIIFLIVAVAQIIIYAQSSWLREAIEQGRHQECRDLTTMATGNLVIITAFYTLLIAYVVAFNIFEWFERKFPSCTRCLARFRHNIDSKCIAIVLLILALGLPFLLSFALLLFNIIGLFWLSALATECINTAGDLFRMQASICGIATIWTAMFLLGTVFASCGFARSGRCGVCCASLCLCASYSDLRLAYQRRAQSSAWRVKARKVGQHRSSLFVVVEAPDSRPQNLLPVLMKAGMRGLLPQGLQPDLDDPIDAAKKRKRRTKRRPAHSRQNSTPRHSRQNSRAPVKIRFAIPDLLASFRGHQRHLSTQPLVVGTQTPREMKIVSQSRSIPEIDTDIRIDIRAPQLIAERSLIIDTGLVHLNIKPTSQNLGKDVTLNIFALVGPCSLPTVAATCRLWRSYSTDSRLWSMWWQRIHGNAEPQSDVPNRKALLWFDRLHSPKASFPLRLSPVDAEAPWLDMLRIRLRDSRGKVLTRGVLGSAHTHHTWVSVFADLAPDAEAASPKASTMAHCLRNLQQTVVALKEPFGETKFQATPDYSTFLVFFLSGRAAFRQASKDRSLVLADLPLFSQLSEATQAPDRDFGSAFQHVSGLVAGDSENNHGTVETKDGTLRSPALAAMEQWWDSFTHDSDCLLMTELRRRLTDIGWPAAVRPLVFAVDGPSWTPTELVRAFSLIYCLPPVARNETLIRMPSALWKQRPVSDPNDG